MKRAWLTVRVELETIGWGPLLAAAVPLLAAAAIAGAQPPSFPDRALLTRLSLAFPAVALPYVIDDRRAELAAALPAGPLRRTLVRVAVVGVAWLGIVGFAVVVAARGAPWTVLAVEDPSAFPMGRLFLESGALAAAGALGGILCGRWWEEDLRMVAATAVGVLFVAALVAPPEWTPFQIPGAPRWGTVGTALKSWIAGCLAASLLVGAARGPLISPTRRGRRRRRP